MEMQMAVRARRHGLVHMSVVRIIVTVGVFVLKRFVFVLVAV